MWTRSQPPVLLVLLQLCSLLVLTGSSPVCPLQGNLVLKTHNHLRDLGGEFPAPCLPYNANISFPNISFSDSVTHSRAQCGRVLSLVWESLEQALTVFGDYDVTTGEDGLNWDEVKFDYFQHLQSRVLEEASCLSSFRSSHLLSSYFDDVRELVQHQDSATCGWEVLRRDLLKVLKVALQKYCNCFTWTNNYCSQRPRPHQPPA